MGNGGEGIQGEKGERGVRQLYKGTQHGLVRCMGYFLLAYVRWDGRTIQGPRLSSLHPTPFGAARSALMKGVVVSLTPQTGVRTV